MSTRSTNKIKKILAAHQPGTVVLPKWLGDQGISRDLQKRYVKSGWLKPIGTGAYVVNNEKVTWKGALYAVQKHLLLPVHVGASTALDLQGQAHYLKTGEVRVFLFSPMKTSLPGWFVRYPWRSDIVHKKTSMLPPNAGLSQVPEQGFNITVSAPERAILECLYLAPDEMDLAECYDLLGGLSNLRPKLLQQLLEKCNSIKVKRLFLHLSHKAGHRWVDYLNEAPLDLGSGDRGIVKSGTYISKYKISVPKELA